MKRVSIAAIVFAVLSLLTACNQKSFEVEATGERYHQKLAITYDRLWHVVYDGGTDWRNCWDETDFRMAYDSLLPAIPSGVRVLVYNDLDEYDIFNLRPYGGDLDVAPGRYTMLLFNNDTEYIIFENIGQETLAQASTRSRSRSSYAGSPFVDRSTNENTITAPDMLFARRGDSFECHSGIINDDIEIEMRPLVYKYLIRYHFSTGAQYVTMARGAIAGMASTVYLNDGHTDAERATILYEIEDSKNIYVADANVGNGMVYAVVNTFGVAGYPNDYYSRSDETYGLNLEVMLLNGKTKNFDFDITDQIKLQPRGGVVDVYGLEVKEEEAAESEGAFKVTVDNWGPHQDIII